MAPAIRELAEGFLRGRRLTEGALWTDGPRVFAEECSPHEPWKGGRSWTARGRLDGVERAEEAEEARDGSAREAKAPNLGRADEPPR
jgi:hypothetical protein